MILFEFQDNESEQELGSPVPAEESEKLLIPVDSDEETLLPGNNNNPLAAMNDEEDRDPTGLLIKSDDEGEGKTGR